jgi:hypothetical protein
LLFNEIVVNSQQIIYKGRDATPTPLTESDLVDIEDHYIEEDQEKVDSLWDILVDEVERKKFQSIKEAKLSSYFEVPDLDDIMVEVRFCHDLILDST